MSTIIRPIHLETIGAAAVRFFAPPSGGREFPWASMSDIYAAMALDLDLREHFQRSLTGSDWATYTRSVATPDGITRIGQHFICQSCIHAMIDVGRCSEDFYWKYARASAAALDKVTGGFSKDELFSYLRDALAVGGGVS